MQATRSCLRIDQPRFQGFRPLPPVWPWRRGIVGSFEQVSEDERPFASASGLTPVSGLVAGPVRNSGIPLAARLRRLTRFRSQSANPRRGQPGRRASLTVSVRSSWSLPQFPRRLVPIFSRFSPFHGQVARSRRNITALGPYWSVSVSRLRDIRPDNWLVRVHHCAPCAPSCTRRLVKPEPGQANPLERIFEGPMPGVDELSAAEAEGGLTPFRDEGQWISRGCCRLHGIFNSRGQAEMTTDWGSVPEWLAAIGTIGATVTALWLARKADRPRVEMFVHPRSSGDRVFADPFLFNQGYEPFTVLSIHVGAGWHKHHVYASGEYDRRPLGHGEGTSAEIDITGVVDAVAGYSNWGRLRRGLGRFSAVAELSNGQRVRSKLDSWQVARLPADGVLRAAARKMPVPQKGTEAQ